MLSMLPGSSRPGSPLEQHHWVIHDACTHTTPNQTKPQKLEGAEPHLDGKSKGEKKNHVAGIRPQERERHNVERRRGLTGSRQERWHLSDGQRWEAQERDPRVVVILSPEVDEAACVIVVD